MTPPTPPSTMQFANADWLRALKRTASVTPRATRTLYDVVAAQGARTPDAPALIGSEAALSYRELAVRATAAATWARREGLVRGDTVALVMGNAPDYAAIWIGLSRVGVITALINTQLVGGGLAHCLALAAPARVIVDASRLAAVRASLGADGPPIWSHGADADGLPLIDLEDGDAAPETFDPIPLSETALLIYTSGTTGLPKAARVSHYRIMMWSEWFAGLLDAVPEDRLYDCLPMYHSIGGVVAVGAMLVSGGAVIVRAGFSARAFWPDVVASGATILQYIGELCRYLVHAAPDPASREHRLRVACGNGLRADVWTAFERRFAIPRILEFYAATEGSFSLFNTEGRRGAIGRVPRFMAHRSPVAIVRFDDAASEPSRGLDGFCIRCGIDEAGEAIGLVAATPEALATRFEGYTTEGDSAKKILRDVFAAGDSWFRTGDLMRRDADGFFYFVDRIGDTFRWKGENVATSEVADHLGTCPGVREAVVYGVAVPFAEGRAGMAALEVTADFSLAKLATHVAAVLPRYARPVFVRLVETLETTGTFKTRKAALQEDGFDPGRCRALYVARDGIYAPLDAGAFAAIAAGAMRL